MSVVLHIGPSKTATKSLQRSLIPHLGVPFEIRPMWARELARVSAFSAAPRDDRDLIVSDEILGDFAVLTPEAVAGRLSQIFANATVVICVREPLALFYSLYRQKLINGITRAPLQAATPDSPAMFLGAQWLQFVSEGTGFFAVIDTPRIVQTFARHFMVKTVEFSLLGTDPKAFTAAFAEACGVSKHVALSHENITSQAKLESALAEHAVPPELRDIFRDHFAAQLSPEQEEFIITSPANRAAASVVLKRSA